MSDQNVRSAISTVDIDHTHPPKERVVEHNYATPNLIGPPIEGKQPWEPLPDDYEMTQDLVGFPFTEIYRYSDLRCNRHLFQQIASSNGKWESKRNNQLLRILPKENFPRLKYYARKNEVKSVIHWGQRKLLMSEIEFLTRFVEKGHKYTVVYAGAAPGTHILFLSNLFPEIHWVLVDPAPFTVKQDDRIEIISALFMPEHAERFSKEPNVLFISDIRSADPDLLSAEEVEERVKSGM